jgi:hypothetical protein
MSFEADFELIYSNYPSKVGKKAAIRHFNASVKTLDDLQDIEKALNNYLQSERVKKGYIQNASTWFNNWRDWIDTTDAPANYKCQRCGYDCQARVSPKECIDSALCFQCFKLKEAQCSTFIS